MKNVARYLRARYREQREAFIQTLDLSSPGAQRAMDEVFQHAIRDGLINAAPTPTWDKLVHGRPASGFGAQFIEIPTSSWKGSCNEGVITPDEEAAHEEDRAPDRQAPSPS